MEDNTEFIEDNCNGNYIRTTRVKMPDSFLDTFIHDRVDFSHIDVFYDDEDDNLGLFYDRISDHPRLEEFMSAEADHILSTFNDKHENPVIKEKFYSIMFNKITNKLGIESSAEQFEEFLDYKRSLKSARS